MLLAKTRNIINQYGRKPLGGEFCLQQHLNYDFYIHFILINWKLLVVRPVLKMKTGFRGFETERNPGFRKFAEIW